MSKDRVSTGINGLDDILLGGFIPQRSYLVRGGPGTGKAIVGLHYLTTGATTGDKTLFITLGESQFLIRKDADTLIKNTDIAMYRAKRCGRNNYHYYTGIVEGKPAG